MSVALCLGCMTTNGDGSRDVGSSVGTVAGSFSGTGGAPTGEKPESKIWWAHGSWFASMQGAGGGYSVFRLERSRALWVDTGVALDERATSRADVVVHGEAVYVASHEHSDGTGEPGGGARLYRLRWDAARDLYVRVGEPSKLNAVSSETLTLDRDSQGTLWATWLEDQGAQVTASRDDGSTWSTPATLHDPSGGKPTADDISALVAFGSSVGVMWSNQATGAFLWAEHRADDPVGTWQATSVVDQAAGLADDHLSLKADSAGRVYAAVKTSLDGPGPKTAPQVLVLTRSLSGDWSSTPFGTVRDCHTRPVVVVDEAAQRLRVFAAGATTGCPFPGSSGTIYEKSSPLVTPSFAPDRGTPVLHDAVSDDLNNPTAAKAPVTSQSGLVVLSSSVTTGRYWYVDRATTQASDASPSATPTVPVRSPRALA